MKQFWSEMAHRALPYVPGEQPKERKYIKLNTNECPYPPSETIQHNRAALEELRLYPDPHMMVLRETLAHRYGLQTEQVFAGNGSDELLAFCFMAFGLQDQPISFADITYSFYPVYAKLFQIPTHIVPLREGFALNLDDFDEGKGPVIIANPNAPTGMFVPTERLVAFLEKHPDRLLIVDEAYVDFGAQSMVPYIQQYPNLLVVQTFSKSRALAGARVGYVMGQESLIEALIRVRDSFNSYTVSCMAQNAAINALEDETYFQLVCHKVIHTRERTAEALRQMGFLLTDSKANFLWACHPQTEGKRLYEALREEGILVRHFATPPIENYLRISIGTDEEMDALLKAMRKIIEEHHENSGNI